MRPLLVAALWLAAVEAVAADFPAPKIVRIYPLGGQRGTSVDVEILGVYLSNATTVEFDCDDLRWTKTLNSSTGKLTGSVSIAPHASLGPHLLRAATQDGYSTSAIFNVGQYASLREVEPHDESARASQIAVLPVEVQGRLDGAADIDQFQFHARAGQRWIFDLRSIEHGSSVEVRMALLDENGERVAFDDDRNDFDENPLITHTFKQDGLYHLKLDQYRGPRGFNFGKNCAYILRISALPVIVHSTPWGMRRGRTTRLRIGGAGLGRVERVYLTELRQAEYTRLTYPFTMPVHFRSDPPAASKVARLDGRIISKKTDVLEVEFTPPATAALGLWRLWAAGVSGVADGPKVEISDWAEYSESEAARADWTQGGYVINGSLDKPREQDAFRIQGVAGRTLHFWTLAAQLGGPFLDSVLELRDAAGKKLAENDDVVAGQGSLIGNPDSSIFYAPKENGWLTLVVKDRIKRGGSGLPYRLKVASESPGFQLFTTPENFTVPRGGAGTVKVHLIREAGFQGVVSIWFDGMPPGVDGPRGAFRADQLFEPNADGADMIIPEITFSIQAPPTLAAGTYPIRVWGAGEGGSPVVEAHTNVMIGPLLDLWNFIRRPSPAIDMTVVEPFEARLSSQARSVNLERGKSTTIELKAAKVPENASFEVRDLPAGVSYRVLGRQDDQVTVMLEATRDAALGAFDISVEAALGSRRASSEPVALSIQEPDTTESR